MEILAILKALPWRLIGYGAIIAGILFCGWRVKEWHDAYKELPSVQANLENEQACGEGSKCAEKQKQLAEETAQVTNRVVNDYENELQSLRNRQPPPRVVRLCADKGSVRDASASPSVGSGASVSGMVPGGTGENPDIGPALRSLARKADELSAQLRALQKRDRALADGTASAAGN